MDIGLLILRLGVGCIVLYYGAQKMLGFFGGPGFTQQVTEFGKMQIPPLFATLSIFAEFFGSLGLIFGVLTRIAALGIFINMCVACWFTVTHSQDLFHNAFTLGQGVDARTLFYPISLCFGALALLFLGGGRFSVDSRIFARKGR